MKRSMNLYERYGIFEIFEPMGAFEGEIGAKTLLEMGLCSILIQFLHWILIKLSRKVENHDEWSYINFKVN